MTLLLKVLGVAVIIALAVTVSVIILALLDKKFPSDDGYNNY